MKQSLRKCARNAACYIKLDELRAVGAARERREFTVTRQHSTLNFHNFPGGTQTTKTEDGPQNYMTATSEQPETTFRVKTTHILVKIELKSRLKFPSIMQLATT
ncbi:hypothetical protein T265_03180 [Opisthorchis viverrini]|uniref:Uncharacterized protein n=1 Tax=Opisthorchis viverrini TaxID=6198 RepID=A0A074ZWQ2_OPIVI|nr:hypothetical protein T265_03180 [Opisthorchis viverrini]KER30337.1 hypothetical protein T265_03180 [Opisthorchis viverrini]